MATETTNYKLKKQEYNEYVDIGVLNENFDALDEKLKEIEEAAAEDKTMSGVYIEKGSMPLDRLAEIPTAESIGAVKEVELPTKIKNLIDRGEISMVKRIQRGVITIPSGSASATAAITAVNTAKAVVLYGGASGGKDNGMGSSEDGNATLQLTSSTVVTATRFFTTYNATVPYQVIEYY